MRGGEGRGGEGRGGEGRGGREVISVTTIDRGRVVGAFTHFSRYVCVGLVFSGGGS